MEHDMFEDGDPWDHIVQMTITLEKLVLHHNEMVDKVLKLEKQCAIYRAQIKELKTVLITTGMYDQCIKK